MCVSVTVYIYIHTYIYIHIYVCVCVFYFSDKAIKEIEYKPTQDVTKSIAEVITKHIESRKKR